MFDLSGQFALVTGATGGIGGAIARVLHARGAHVGLSGTRQEKLESLAGELGERVSVLPCDLSDSAAVDALVPNALATMGGLEILVNNAGLTRDQLAMRLKDEDWDLVMNVNLRSAFKLSRAVLKGFMKQRYGRIINISSVVAAMGNAGQCNYAASKAGLIALSKSMAREVATRGITVNAIAPGFIRSDMTEALNDAQKSAILTQIPAGRLGEAEEVAQAALYLASKEAGYVTGQSLHINGGMVMI